MSDAANEQVTAFNVNIQYIKDLSFEAPNSPQILPSVGTIPPDNKLSVRIDTQRVGDHLYDVALRLQLESKMQEKVAFILDLTYCGIFTVQLPEESLQPVLGIECPRILFPFARAILMEAMRDGGFPPAPVPMIDFAALYRVRLEELAAEQQGKPS